MTEVKKENRCAHVCDRVEIAIDSRITIKDTGLGQIGIWTKNGEYGHMIIRYTDVAKFIEALQYVESEMRKG